MHKILCLRGCAIMAALLVCFALAPVASAQDSEHKQAEKAEKAHDDAAHSKSADTQGAGEKGGHDAEHPQGVPLDWQRDLAFWSFAVFLIFAFLLGKFAWGPIIAGLDKREAGIRGDIEGAEQARIKAEQMLADHSAKLSKVQDEVREILAEARRDAEHTKQEIVSDAQKEAEANKRRMIADIERAKDTALKDLFDVVSGQVTKATEHVLQRTLNPADQNRLIQEALSDFHKN